MIDPDRVILPKYVAPSPKQVHDDKIAEHRQQYENEAQKEAMKQYAMPETPGIIVKTFATIPGTTFSGKPERKPFVAEMQNVERFEIRVGKRVIHFQKSDDCLPNMLIGRIDHLDQNGVVLYTEGPYIL